MLSAYFDAERLKETLEADHNMKSDGVGWRKRAPTKTCVSLLMVQHDGT